MPRHVPVLIAGGGPVGLTLAALLGRHGVPSLVIEADATYCEGSRAICISRRSQEIMAWAGAERELLATGLPWTGGRSYHRDTEVLHFTMPTDATERFAPMLNIQQFSVERIAHAAACAAHGRLDVRWSTKVVDVRQRPRFVEVDIESVDGERSTVHADWLVAADGGRSTVRERCGLALEGVQYEGRYVIVDIEQETSRPVERLAWFDPPSNPGSTLLMHRQPGNVWRIDYQVADDEDPVEAVRPENVLPRVSSHLAMIGETAPWKPLWISIYNAKCLTLNDYRHGRILFAGDAAHLVPIFGVRGLNSGLDDAGNLAWKLALVVQRRAAAATASLESESESESASESESDSGVDSSDDLLLDSYSAERVHAARQNIAFGAKSTEFMAPPHFGFRLMREAALRLARECEAVRSLVNPRQSTPIAYADSPLNVDVAGTGIGTSPGAGDVAPEACVIRDRSPIHLTQLFGHRFVALLFSDGRHESPSTSTSTRPDRGSGLAGLDIHRIAPAAAEASDGDSVLADENGEAWGRYRATEGSIVLVRPDGYILGRWDDTDGTSPDGAANWPAVQAALAPFRAGLRDTGRSPPERHDT